MHFVSLPARRRPQGFVVIGVCLSVCLSVCLCVRTVFVCVYITAICGLGLGLGTAGLDYKSGPMWSDAVISHTRLRLRPVRLFTHLQKLVVISSSRLLSAP